MGAGAPVVGAVGRVDGGVVAAGRSDGGVGAAGRGDGGVVVAGRGVSGDGGFVGREDGVERAGALGVGVAEPGGRCCVGGVGAGGAA